MSLGEQPPAPVERIVFVAAMTESVLLGAATHLVESGVRELDDVERVRDLDRVRQRVVERLAIRPRQIQRRPPDVVPPRLWLAVDPCRRRLGCATLDNIEELARPGDLLGPVPQRTGKCYYRDQYGNRFIADCR